METAVDLRKITVAEFRQMEFDDNDPFLYELINGELVKKTWCGNPTPTPRHQRISRRIEFAIDVFINKHQLGEIFNAPIDVFLDGENGLQPDLLFIPTADAQLVTNDGIMGPPTLVVEIISPTSVYRDRIEKRAIYERHGVQEYWLVDPQEELIEILALQNHRYELLSGASPDEGRLVSTVFSGLEIDVAAVFLTQQPGVV